MKVLGMYKNGNYYMCPTDIGVMLRRKLDGEEKFKPIFPEVINIKISDFCKYECQYCPYGFKNKHTDSDLSELFTEFRQYLKDHNNPPLMENFYGDVSDTNLEKYKLDIPDENIRVISKVQSLTKDAFIFTYQDAQFFDENPVAERIYIQLGVTDINAIEQVFQSFMKQENKKQIIFKGFVDNKYTLPYRSLCKNKINEQINLIKTNLQMLQFFNITFDDIAIEQLDLYKLCGIDISKTYEALVPEPESKYTLYIDVPNKLFGTDPRKLKPIENKTITTLFEEKSEN